MANFAGPSSPSNLVLPERLARIRVAFDNHHLVANAGLILPVTPDLHVGRGELAAVRWLVVNTSTTSIRCATAEPSGCWSA